MSPETLAMLVAGLNAVNTSGRIYLKLREQNPEIAALFDNAAAEGRDISYQEVADLLAETKAGLELRAALYAGKQPG